MRVYLEGDLAVKEATEAGDTARLRREAVLLTSAAHPGVVSVRRFEDGEEAARLLLRRVDGTPASELGAWPLEVGAGWAAALATTVADLHDLGVVHGQILPEHVLIERKGRPVLCGFGGATSGLAPAELVAGQQADVTSLAVVVAGWLDGGQGGGAAGSDRRLRRLGDSRRRWRSARTLADAVLRAVPDARLDWPGPAVTTDPDGGPPGSATVASPSAPATRSSEAAQAAPATEPAPAPDAAPAAAPASAAHAGHVAPAVPAAERARRIGNLGRAWLVGGIVVAGGAAAVAAVLPRAGHRARVAPMATPAVGSTAVRLGSFRLAPTPGTDPFTVLGRWSCGPATPAVLDVHSGWVWVFSAWPKPGQTLKATPVAHEPGAIGIAASRSQPGCDRLSVLEPDGRSVVVAIPGGPR